MRPVRLDIDGFASFREPATVDFTDVDYFALVGPTGSGKSTLVDAITFALYGTAYRWERANAISYALAPTTNRCTVSLIFDVSGKRYQVVREVRKVGQSIQQKAARLERFLDPTACPAPGDPPVDTEVLVSEVSALTPAVAELLGMEFDDFCQCVVLPQGEFARFLKAAPRDRQTILLKLLGAGHYDHIGKVAGVRAKEAEKEVEMYADQLRGLAHATPDTVAEATARRDVLADLNDTISDLVAPVLTARAEEDTHRKAAKQATVAAAALSGVKAPEGLTDRQATLTAASTAHAKAAGVAQAATAAYAAVTKAYDAGPQRSRLETADDLYTQADQIQAALETAKQEATATEQATTRAGEAAENAAELDRRARTAADQARTAQLEAAAHLSGVEAQLSRLRAVTVPADLDEIAGATREAAAQFTDAETALQAAKITAAEAAAACTDLPDPRTLDTLDSDVATLLSDVARWETEEETRSQLQTTAEEAAATLHEAAAAVDSAWAALEEARTVNAAAALRPALVVGHECPVCTQTVTTLPPPAEGPYVDALTNAWKQAQAGRTAAVEQHQKAVRALESFAARHDALHEQIGSSASRITTAVAGLTGHNELSGTTALDVGTLTPSTAHEFAGSVTSTLAAARDRSAAAFAHRDEKAADVEAAEKALAVAREATASARERADTHRSALVRVHAVLDADGAPPIDATSIEGTITGWHNLAAWRDQTRQHLEADLLPAATAKAQTAAAEASRTVEAARKAETTATQATAEAKKAAAVASAATTLLEQLTAREADLATRIKDLPAREELPALLAEADRLAAARTQAARDAEEAQAQAQAAAAALQAAERAVIADRDTLSAARDTVASWGPPVFAAERLSTNLAGCFDDLVTWAAASATEHTNAAAESQKAQQAAAERAATQLATLVEKLTTHDLPAAEVDADPRAAERVVAVAHTRSIAEAERLAEALTRKDELVTKAEDARERAVVAGELRSLLRSDKFQQWLATAALDTLVAGASESLAELSDGQFTLTHDKGEFFVIDHFDADSPRSVRTLSGGETFQASLALALALSEQLATLAVGGNARLDSIFLDEGFGTLDPDALEMVAATLENLAQGERMVGVITHVAALAERTPVRFLVSHDNRTSRVEKEAV